MDFSLIPDSAPFNPEQKAWLNGFLAGWLGLSHTSVSATSGVAVPALSPPQAETPEPEPWHDPALPLDERIQLAEGKPLAHRLMAAMAQLDCGTCGYVCRTYAEALESGAEKSFTLCSPGGSETARMLKTLVKERASEKAPVASLDQSTPATNGWSRQNPYPATLIRTERLNGPGSEKETRHIEIALGSDGPSYDVGDSLGVYPENCPQLVEDLISALQASGDEPVSPPS
ncbi:MAG TPA: sulfite reductase subunit alpha, partial [Isosphaeraceae bacterium]|nr:sulfite reductase subunit alpha [Isosphaeraceae bacterium]